MSQRPFYPVRVAHGGQRSTHDLLSAIRKVHGITCCVLCRTSSSYLHEYFPDSSQWSKLGINEVKTRSEVTTFDCGYPIEVFTGDTQSFWSYLHRRVGEFNPHVVLTGQRKSIEILRWCAINGIPTIWNLDTLPGQGVYDSDHIRVAQQHETEIICCSKFLQQHLYDSTGVIATVVYPPMSISDFSTRRETDSFITVINPVQAKGGGLLEPLIANFQTENFLVVEGWELGPHTTYWDNLRRRLESYSNIHFAARTPDIRTVFSKTKLLLVPSQWKEALGRVVWEAQCSGIPCVVSNIGGLPEILGFGGLLVEDYKNVKAWTHTLHAILGNPVTMAHLSNLAYLNVVHSPISVEKSAETFLRVARRIAKT